jgi:uncharacterized protein YaiE (UPF0345 family)
VQVLNHLDFGCLILLSGDVTAGAFSVKERGRLGCMTPLHVHTKEAETFVVIDGALEGWCGGRSNMVEAGSLIHLPAGSEHGLRSGSESAHFYAPISPSGFESFGKQCSPCGRSDASCGLLRPPLGGAVRREADTGGVPGTSGDVQGLTRIRREVCEALVLKTLAVSVVFARASRAS